MIDVSYEFAQEMVLNLEQTIEHPEMTEELVGVLSTSVVRVEYRIGIRASVR